MFGILANFLNIKSISIIALICLILGVGLYIMFLRNEVLNLKSNIGELEAENFMLKEKLEESELYIKNLKSDYNAITTYNAELQKTANDLRLKQQALQAKLQKLNVGFDEMVKKHPKLVEKAINNGQVKTNDCFESLSKHEECK